MSENESLRERGSAILRELQDDVALVPPDLQEWWRSYLDYHHDRYLRMLSYVDSTSTDVLEVGSVPGHFTALLGGLGYTVRGVDLDPDRIRDFWQKHGLEVRKADIETQRLPFPDQSFDLVLFAEVLEHLRINPLFTLRELQRVLRPQGRLIISTPNITPAHRVMFLFGKNYLGNLAHEYKKLETVGHMGHIRLWSHQDLRDFLDEIDMRIASVHFEGQYIVGGWKTRLLRFLYPVKRHFRTYTYYVVRNG